MGNLTHSVKNSWFRKPHLACITNFTYSHVNVALVMIMVTVVYVPLVYLQAIEFVFTSFALESSSTCDYDSLTLYDGPTDSAPFLEKFCGYDEPEPVYTTGNTAILIFQTDSSRTRSGFEINFSAVDEITPTAISPTHSPSKRPDQLWPLLLTWFNFNPSMDK